MEPNKTKGQLEADITAAFTQFEREHLGRGPREARAYIIGDMIVVRLKGVLTPAEQNLAGEHDGVESIKRIRQRLIESSRPVLSAIIQQRTGMQMVSLHTDISIRNGERVFVIVLDSNLEDMLRA